ncbi:MAG: DUF1254 domain-containing protein [Hyphomonadaceae bacterium]
MNRQEPDYLSAYYFGFPIFEFMRTGWIAAAQTERRPQHRFNQVTHRRGLTNHNNRGITAPNNDTVYSSCRLDLSNGPVLMDIPTIRDRYFSVAFMNAYTDNFAHIGTRATSGEGGHTLIVGPDWQDNPPEGARLIRSETADVWMVARILVDGEEDIPAANALQDQLRVLDAPPPSQLDIAPGDGPDLENFLAVVNATLARASLRDPVGAQARQFSAAGVNPGAIDAWGSLAEGQRAAWRTAADQATTVMRQGFALRGEYVAGWRYPPHGIGEASASFQVRAAVALSGLAALDAKEATYGRAQEDTSGAALDGANAYELVVPNNVPASAFWSVSMYQLEADGRLFFVDNPIHRYAVGDRSSGIARNTDGSISIRMQRGAPRDSGNWLPTPQGPFALIFRAYLPQEPWLSGAWRLPAVRRL